MLVLTEKQHRQIEAASSSLGVNEALLMQNAGTACADYIFSACQLKGASVALLCGGGGNGGDGMVAALRLSELGARPTVLLCGKTPQRSVASVYYKAVIREAIPVLDCVSEYDKAIEALKRCDVAVDAVFGIGCHGPLPEHIVPFTKLLNKISARVFSLDLPSGMEADGGAYDQNCVRADETLCFIAKKPAHILKRSAPLCGKVTVLDIGVPPKAYSSVKDAFSEVTAADAAKLILPKSVTAHKGDCGRLLCIAGSDSYRGAAVLCAKGAVRAGAGIVEVASSEKVLCAVASHIAEPILHNIFENDIDVLVEKIRAASAVALGCGLSQSEDASRLVQLVMLSANSPVVVDADGINLLADNIKLIEDCAAPVILTPHLGEFARLSHTPIEQISANRFGSARYFAVTHKCVVVLKSEDTVIAAPKGELFAISNGNSGLAKGGSGDLLTGMISAYCAMGIAPLSAAVLGAYLHSSAADIAARTINKYSMTADDVALNISEAINLLHR